MAAGAVTSHQVNYLIWRYLQESGYGEAAIMLQRAWNPDPQKLPFAPAVKSHALITLIQKGLQYFDLEQCIDQKGGSVSSSTVSFFGSSVVERNISKVVENFDKPKEVVTAGPSADPSTTAARTSLRTDGIINGQQNSEEAVPDTRKSSEVEDVTIDHANADEMVMQLDKPEQTAEQSPVIQSVIPSTKTPIDVDGDIGMVEPQAPGPQTPTFTLTSGQSVGVQISPAKAADLAPETNVMDVLKDSHVMRTSWRPNDPLFFAVASDVFCGLWKLSSQRSPTPPTHTTLVAGSCITAMDWDSSGAMLAVATYDKFMGSITIFNSDGEAIDSIPESSRLISALRWAEKTPQIAIVTSDGRHSELSLWNHQSRGDSLSPAQVINGPIYDVVWCGQTQIFASGDGSVYQCNIDGNIQPPEIFTSGEELEPWAFLKVSLLMETPVAVVASASPAHVWIPTHGIRIESAHHGDITGLEIRPGSLSAGTQNDPNFAFATSSMDYTVKLWNLDLPAKKVHCIHRLFLGTASPALAVNFSPDGYAIAAASYNKLAIWSVDRCGAPMATWQGSHNDVMDESNQEELETHVSNVSMLDRPLSWDSDGKKIALGFGKKVCRVNNQSYIIIADR
ncbi:hypothetical protein LOZ67_000193 [Ophidiomyces ophidiicola]|nr:hypothetical protein LOZ59_002164 [Ophidiomyces ophidiicola]KAI2403156.1 hypothetical protein LOZ67_000193 [Ophidiomyces ophidiicola]